MEDRRTELSQFGNLGVLFDQHRYTLGPNGNRLQHAELNGRVVDYAYDDLYRLTAETVTDPNLGNRTSTWTYDAVGNRLSQSTTVGAASAAITTYVYNNNDRLLSETATGAAPGSTTYTYDNNGNTLTKFNGAMTTTYAYDSRNRLSNLNAGQVTYQYDATGIRQSETAAGLTTHYLTDPNRDFAQVVEESFDLNAFAEVKYTYGDDLVAQHRRINATTTNSSTFHYDGIGSTRELTDETGSITDQYTFTAFGETEGTAGITQNDYLYTGEQFDPNLGFYYLRARYYNPGVGRFATLDRFDGRLFEPVTLHKYLYANADPANILDPSGRVSIAELNVVMSLRGLVSQFQLDGGLSSVDILGIQNPAISGIRKANFILGLASIGSAGVKIVKWFSTRFQRQRFSFRFTPVDRGPLPLRIASTFRSGTYTAKYATKNTVLYRSFGGRSRGIGDRGSFWIRTKPKGHLQNKIDSALLDDFGNTQSDIVTIEVPEGTILYEGIAGPQISRGGTQILPGGGNQVYLPFVDPAWKRK